MKQQTLYIMFLVYLTLNCVNGMNEKLLHPNYPNENYPNENDLSPGLQYVTTETMEDGYVNVPWSKSEYNNFTTQEAIEAELGKYENLEKTGYVKIVVDDTNAFYMMISPLSGSKVKKNMAVKPPSALIYDTDESLGEVAEIWKKTECVYHGTRESLIMYKAVVVKETEAIKDTCVNVGMMRIKWRYKDDNDWKTRWSKGIIDNEKEVIAVFRYPKTMPEKIKVFARRLSYDIHDEDEMEGFHELLVEVVYHLQNVNPFGGLAPSFK